MRLWVTELRVGTAIRKRGGMGATEIMIDSRSKESVWSQVWYPAACRKGLSSSASSPQAGRR